VVLFLKPWFRKRASSEEKKKTKKRMPAQNHTFFPAGFFFCSSTQAPEARVFICSRSRFLLPLSFCGRKKSDRRKRSFIHLDVHRARTAREKVVALIPLFLFAWRSGCACAALVVAYFS
jgi:hypothetical protein